MADLKVQIVTPSDVAFQAMATEVSAPGFHGAFGVLPDHAPFLSVMKPGVVEIKTTAGDTARFIVGRGFVEAGPTAVTILAESWEDIGAVDAKTAEAQLDEAEKALASVDPDSGEWRQAELEAELNRARLSV